MHVSINYFQEVDMLNFGSFFSEFWVIIKKYRSKYECRNVSVSKDVKTHQCMDEKTMYM